MKRRILRVLSLLGACPSLWVFAACSEGENTKSALASATPGKSVPLLCNVDKCRARSLRCTDKAAAFGRMISLIIPTCRLSLGHRPCRTRLMHRVFGSIVKLRLLRAYIGHRRIRAEPSISLSAAGGSVWPAVDAARFRTPTNYEHPLMLTEVRLIWCNPWLRHQASIAPRLQRATAKHRAGGNPGSRSPNHLPTGLRGPI